MNALKVGESAKERAPKLKKTRKPEMPFNTIIVLIGLLLVKPLAYSDKKRYKQFYI